MVRRAEQFPKGSELCARHQLGARQMQGSRNALERIQGDHALPALDFTDVREAEVRLKRELLLRQFTGKPLGAQSRSELALKSGGTIRHRYYIIPADVLRLPIIVNIWRFWSALRIFLTPVAGEGPWRAAVEESRSKWQGCGLPDGR